MTPLVRELRIVYSPVEQAGPLLEVGRPADAAALFRDRLEQEPIEVCLALLVNTKHRILAVHELSRGTLDSCPVHPRELFKAAILANAAAVIVGHNHLSGDPTPSRDDVDLCARLRTAADIIGIDLLDFIVVAEGRYYSFKEAGR